ncbi:GNAT family N-acetyltransferase [Dawidia soli]|uniref:GNAT family N-acetyltransferase n=1 Tax=Dawidia soli TaxID=2782352 RepID=A0AAP2D6I6_9BACT|nr:GNAT family N-acetyltransferase [Dawidia soli]MBT1686308.1 GNAT family N-acetyltransferase [Dawidia soli]
MTASLSIDPLGNDRSREVIDIILPIQQLEFNVPVTLEAQPDLLQLEEVYHGSGGGFWGAQYNGQLVGTIGLIAFAGPAGAIRKMFVRKEFRGRELGIAQQLLDTLVTCSRQRGLQALYLGTVSQLHAAIRFYERNGFRRIEKQDLPPAFPVMAVDTVFYYLDLSPRS